MREFDTTSGAIAGIFTDRGAAEAALPAIREAGFSAAVLTPGETRAHVPGTGSASPLSRRSALLGGALGGAGGILAEATVLAVPAGVPTLLGGSLIAAAIGGTLGAFVAAIFPAAVLEHAQESDLLREVRAGRAILSVSPRGRVRRERARALLRQHGASMTLDLDDREEAVRFARPFAEVAPRLEQHCLERCGTGRWDAHVPAYVFGWDRAGRPDLDETAWKDARAALESEWSRRHPERPWGEVEDAVRAGWEEARAPNI